MTKSSHDAAVEEDQTNATARRAKGEFVRGVSAFRNTLGDPAFPAEPNRYHLFVALNCPWCHRVTLARAILGLQDSISMDVVFPNRTDETDPAGPNLWQFAPDKPASTTQEPFAECTNETATGLGLRLIKEIYQQENSTEHSVPILYDKAAKRIVNNESAEIIRMLNDHATNLGSTLGPRQRPRLYPPDSALRADIDDLNLRIYTGINNGAYKAGFSSDQAVYAAAYTLYFETLTFLESRLAADDRPYLCGDQFTEADLRLFPTLYRHDPVYYVRMKLNGARILDFPFLWRWLCRVHGLPGVAQSSALDHCRQGYFGRSWNSVVPLGPFLPMAYPDAYQHPELA